MKMNLSPMELVRNIGTIVAVVSVLGTAAVTTAYSAGWIIRESSAEEIAQTKANEVQQQLLAKWEEYEQDRKLDRLQYEKDQLEGEIRDLTAQIELRMSKPNRTDWDNQQLQFLQDQLLLKQTSLEELNHPQPKAE